MPIDRTKPLVQVKDLKKYFPIRGNIFAPVKGQSPAVCGMSFEDEPGKSVCLVGESG